MNNYDHLPTIVLVSTLVVLITGCQTNKAPATAAGHSDIKASVAAPVAEREQVADDAAAAKMREVERSRIALQEQADQEKQRMAAEAARQEQARLAAQQQRAAEAAAAKQREIDARRKAAEVARQAEAEKERMRMEQEAARKRELEAQRIKEEKTRLAAAAEQARLQKEQEAMVAAKSAAETAKPVSSATGAIAGTVKLTAGRKALPTKGVIVALEPIDSNLIPPRAGKTHLIEMKDKRFLPKFSHIRVGDTVQFKNFDPFLHNVFSLSGRNRFDLGTYGKGTEPTHTFEHTGVVKTYCNIHPDMACFVYISSADLCTVVGEDGSYSIDAIPPGDYTLKTWSVRGKQEQAVTISKGGNVAIDVEIDTAGFKKKRHLNKDGKKYKRRSLDESY